jgi:hypothetical protein
MPLLIIPAVLLVALVAWVTLLPYFVWRQYRLGHARRRAVPWILAVNAWTLLASTTLFVTTMSLTSLVWDGSLSHALLGLIGGTGIGLAGTWLCRLETVGNRVFLKPNHWPVLAVYLLVAARLVLTGADWWRAVSSNGPEPSVPLLDRAGLTAVAGVVLGYYLSFTWGLRWRLARFLRNGPPPDQAGESPPLP